MSLNKASIGSSDDASKEGKMLATFLSDTTGIALKGMKKHIPMFALDEPFRLKMEMIVALKENRPTEVFRVVGSHKFAEKDADIVHIFLQCAAEMMEMNGDLKELGISDSNTCSSSSPSPSSSPPLVFAQPEVPKLTPFSTTVLRELMDKNGGLLSKKDACRFARRFNVTVSMVQEYCERNRERHERSTVRLLKAVRKRQAELTRQTRKQ